MKKIYQIVLSSVTTISILTSYGHTAFQRSVSRGQLTSETPLSKPAVKPVIERKASTPRILTPEQPDTSPFRTLSRGSSSRSSSGTESPFSDASSVSFDEPDGAPSPPMLASKPAKAASTTTHLNTLTAGIASKYALHKLEPAVKEALVTQLQNIDKEEPRALVNSYRQRLVDVRSSGDTFKASRAANKLKSDTITADTAKASFIKKAVKQALASDLAAKKTLLATTSASYDEALTDPTVAATAKALAGFSASEARNIAKERATQATAAENAARQALKEHTAITAMAEERKTIASQKHAAAVTAVAMNKKAFHAAQKGVDDNLEILANVASSLAQTNRALVANQEIMDAAAKSWIGMVPRTQTYNDYYIAKAAIQTLTATKEELAVRTAKLKEEVARAKEQLATRQTAYKTAQQIAAEQELSAAATKTEADKAIEAATAHKNSAQSTFESAQLASQSTTTAAEAIGRKEAHKKAQQRAAALHLTLPTDLGTLTAGVKISGDLAATDVINNLSPDVKTALIEKLQSVYKTFEKRPDEIAKRYEKRLKKMSATSPSYIDDQYKKNTAVAKIQTLHDATPEEIALKAKESFIKKYIKSALQHDAELKRASSLKAHLATDYRATNQQTPPEVARLSKIARDAENTVAYVDSTRKSKVEAARRIEDAAHQEERAKAAATHIAAQRAAQEARLETVPGKIEAKLHTVREKAGNALKNVIRRIKEPAKPKEAEGSWAPRSWSETFEGIQRLHDRVTPGGRK